MLTYAGENLNAATLAGEANSSLFPPAALARVMDGRRQVALPSDGWREKDANGVLF